MSSSEIKAEKAIKWIDTLKTTQVKQGTDMLGDSSRGYCCLGLGCKISGVSFYKTDTESEEFRNVIGMKESNGSFDTSFFSKEGGPSRITLIDLNDSANLSFRRISTQIKSRIGEIFNKDVAEIITNHYQNLKDANKSRKSK
jgi:hypothetical protein